MSRSIVTLTTDFGTSGSYAAQMKGVILSINPEATIVDVTHEVAPQDVRGAALIMDEAAPRFPERSIHVCVVDPGVGTQRRIIAAEAGGRFFVAPDNGVLGLLLARFAARRLVAVTNPQYRLDHVTATFHGRDIMAPAAAHLSRGASLEDLGPRDDRFVQLDWPTPRVGEDRIEGQVVFADRFGNLITNIDAASIPTGWAPEELCVECNGREMDGLVRTYAQAPSGSLVALFGSSHRLELAVVNGDAARRLQAAVGARVTVRRSPNLPEHPGNS